MSSKVPKAYLDFIERFPELGQAWDLMRDSGENAGPLDERTRLLIKLGIAIGAQRSGATSSATRKALKAGLSNREIDQVIALAASTVGMPAAVAAFQWMNQARNKLDHHQHARLQNPSSDS